MTGWKIFSHSVFLLNHNLKDAVRISSPLIVMMVISMVMGGADIAAGDVLNPNAQASPNILLQLATGIAGLWVAVAWHRFVLLEERGGIVPTFHGRQMVSYFLVFLFITIALFVIGFSLGFCLGFLIALLGGTSTVFMPVLMIVLFIAFLWIFYRLSPMLPAAALGQRIGPKTAWNATAPISVSVLWAAILLIIFMVVGGAAAVFIVMQVSALIGILTLGVVQWAATMAGISILTTIYGVAVEGREI